MPPFRTKMRDTPRKIRTLLLILLLALSLGLLLPPSSGSVAANIVRQHNISIPSSGSIVYNGTLVPIRYFAIVYGRSGYDEATADYIASHFDILDTDCFHDEFAIGLDRMKQQNPDLEILIYWNIMATTPKGGNPQWDTVNQHEDWFLHDIHGNRIQNKKYGWYAMDVGNEGWRTHYANMVTERINLYPLDGVFADDVWIAFPCDGANWNPWTTSLSSIPRSIGDRWHSDMLGMIQYVKQRLGSNLLILNCGANTEARDYVDASDGCMEEEFVHPGWYSYTEWYPNYIRWQERVDWVREISRSGKYIMVHSGFEELDTASSDIVHRMVMYCLGSYLLAIDGPKGTFGFGGMNTQYKGYYDEFDEAKLLGHPVGDYFQSGECYLRNFENGVVIVNPTDSNHRVTVNGVQHTMEARSGKFVFS